MDTDRIIKDAIENLEKNKSVVYSTDNKLSKSELNDLKKILTKSIKQAIKKQKSKINVGDIVLDSGEKVDESQLEEGVNRLLAEGNVLENESEVIEQENLRKLDEYLTKRNFSEEEKEKIKKEYLKYGISDSLKEKIISGIVNYLQENKYDNQAIEIAKSVVKEELQNLKKSEFNINFDGFINDYKPKRTQHKNLSSIPIIQIQKYPSTYEGLKKFGEDYGIDEGKINDLITKTNKDEIINLIANDLEKNHMFLGSPEENEIIRQFFIEDIKEKIEQLNNSAVLKPIEALNLIYSELGFSEVEKKKFLDNAKQKGTPGKNFYRKTFSKLDIEQKDISKKIDSLSEMVGVKKRKKVKMVKRLSKENKKIIQEDYLNLIKKRQQIFENMYSLNRMVKLGVNENIVSANNYKIINERPARNSITLNKVKKATIKAQMNLRDRIKHVLFNNHLDLNLAVGDLVKIKDEIMPILALKINDLIVTTKNSSLKKIMKDNNLSEARLEFAVSTNNDTYDFYPYTYSSIDEIYKNEHENEKVK